MHAMNAGLLKVPCQEVNTQLLFVGGVILIMPIEFCNVNKSFTPDTVVLNNVSFNLEWKSCNWLKGDNGSGKTTIIRLMVGLLKPDSGYVKIMGLDPYYDISPRQFIGFIMNKEGTDPLLTARENLEFFYRVYKKTRLPHHESEFALERVGLGDYSDKKVRTFSTGMKKRLEIAKLMLCEPRIIICDEPFSGLDEQGVVLFKEFIKHSLKNDVCILISEHNERNVEGVCDKKLIINHGLISNFN
jgi:ABC-type multidrug transport system ATPase subunit